MDLFSGENLKAKGIKQVLANNADWQSAVHAVLTQLCQSRETFTAEDLRKACAAAGIPDPKHPNAWGAAINSASKSGLIEQIGHKKNHMSSAHARIVGVWRAARRYHGSSDLKPDELPWVEVAKDIIDGKYDSDMTSTMRESLMIGVRSINHPLCKQATLYLGSC